jgi:hypothetical protein
MTETLTKSNIVAEKGIYQFGNISLGTKVKTFPISFDSQT